MKAALDNATLIRAFLTGENSLLANRELRIEKSLDETFLLNSQGILLAKGRFRDALPTVMVRLESDYWKLIHQPTLDANYIPFQLNQALLDGEIFAEYEYHSVPAGYQIHCEVASTFWKTWWLNHRKLELMDMLLLCGRRWYPVQKMLCETGTIYIKTWHGEHNLGISDTIVWLDRNTHSDRKRPQTKKHNAKPQTPQTVAYGSSSQQSAPPVHRYDPDTPIVPADLRSVVSAGHHRLIVQTVLGPIIIEGKDLTCTLGRKIARVS